MTFALRESVANRLPASLPNVDNAGLELSRYLKAQKGSDPELTLRNELLDRVCGTTVPDGYRDAFERWETAVSQLSGEPASARFSVKGRLVVGLGTESVLENAITLNRIWGMPIIPGSALKGLASHYTAQVLSHGDADLLPATPPPDAKPGDLLPCNSHGVLFGTTDAAACITWLDAWWVPSTRGDQHPFRRDVITNHHPRYYTNRGTDPAQPPWDFDDPNPVPFVSSAGSFLLALQGPTREWVEFAMRVLAQALEHAGAGAKTSSGYGRGEVGEITLFAEPLQVDDAAPDAAAAERLLAEISATVGRKALSDAAHDWYNRWKAIPVGDQLRVAQAILDQLATSPKVLDRVLSKAYGQELKAFVDEHAGATS